MVIVEYKNDTIIFKEFNYYVINNDNKYFRVFKNIEMLKTFLLYQTVNEVDDFNKLNKDITFNYLFYDKDKYTKWKQKLKKKDKWI